MTSTITRRIVTAVTGPAVAAGILAGALAVGAPAQAQAGTGTATSTATTCVSAPVSGMAPNLLNPLTRAAQVATYEAPSHPTAASSCIGH